MRRDSRRPTPPIVVRSAARNIAAGKQKPRAGKARGFSMAEAESYGFFVLGEPELAGAAGRAAGSLWAGAERADSP